MVWSVLSEEEGGRRFKCWLPLSEEFQVTTALLSLSFGIVHCGEYPTPKTSFFWRPLRIPVGQQEEIPSRLVYSKWLTFPDLKLVEINAVSHPRKLELGLRESSHLYNWFVQLTENLVVLGRPFSTHRADWGIREGGNSQIRREIKKRYGQGAFLGSSWFSDEPQGFRSMLCPFMHVITFPLFSLFCLI